MYAIEVRRRDGSRDEFKFSSERYARHNFALFLASLERHYRGNGESRILALYLWRDEDTGTPYLTDSGQVTMLARFESFETEAN